MMNKETLLFVAGAGMLSYAISNALIYSEVDENYLDDAKEKIFHNPSVQLKMLLWYVGVPVTATAVAMFLATHQSCPAFLQVMLPALAFSSSVIFALNKCTSYMLNNVLEYKSDTYDYRLHTESVITSVAALAIAFGAFQSMSR